MQPLDTKGMQFVYQARLENAANNRRGHAVVNPSNNFFRKMLNGFTAASARNGKSHKLSNRPIS
ncbi:hypothetical protein [Alicyclobacillus fodiniaquatilis]|uniref:Uncharacterized protein n=1 Tax=Alicyclobacillus fodiniaquatilis TaxID=1661150 RepID=A0ABW4JKY1_9BACL